MDTQAKKQELIQWILQLNDEKLLREVDSIREKDTGFWQELTDAQRAAIKRGIDQLDAGQYFDYEQIMAKYR